MRAPGSAVLVAFGVVALTAASIWWWWPEQTGGALRIPELSVEAQAGKRAFDLYCARCHGESAGGSASGPPLIHRMHRTAHHADVAFELAVRRGVRAHHWRFGDMPPEAAVAQVEVGQITRYVREVQRANGIE